MLAFWIFFSHLRQNACSQVLQSECSILHGCKCHYVTRWMFQLRDTLIVIHFHINSACAHHFKTLLKKNCQLESLYNIKSTLFFLTSGLFCFGWFFVLWFFGFFLRESWCNLISRHKMAQTLADKSVGGPLKTASYTDVYDRLYMITSTTRVTILKKGRSLWHKLCWLSQWPGMLFTEESWIMLSWQDSFVLAHLRLVSQEHSGWRRTQHHLKAQLHRSSFSSTGTKHPTKPEAFCRRAQFLTEPRAHL